MAETLAGGNVAMALLCNTLATGAVLVALILTFGPVSGAHLNPAVSLADLLARRLGGREAAGYVIAQFAGGLLGVWLAHAMFAKPVLMISQLVGALSAVALFHWLWPLRASQRAIPRPAAQSVPFGSGSSGA